MLSLQQNQLISEIKNFFESRFTAPANPLQLDEDVKGLLEHPLFKQYIFSNNLVVIIDHSISGYRYFSESVFEVIGIPASEFMHKGISLSFGLMDVSEAQEMGSVFAKATEIVQALTPEERPFMRLGYSMHYNTPRGRILVHQQNIPIAFNEAGLPYLMLALMSDITAYSSSKGAKYKLSLNKPGEAVKILLTNHLEEVAPITSREKDIVQLLADGFDTNEIAEKLFISEGTVRTHRKNILQKTEARNSVHLVRMAVANGWV